MITPSAIILKFKKDFDALSEDTREIYLKNATKLAAKGSELLSAYGKMLVITSGWRPKSYNAQIGGSPNSLHCTCQAVDLWDPDKKFGEWCTANVGRMREIGVYMESLTTTHKSDDPKKRWVHIQVVAPRSGNIIFIP